VPDFKFINEWLRNDGSDHVFSHQGWFALYEEDSQGRPNVAVPDVFCEDWPRPVAIRFSQLSKQLHAASKQCKHHHICQRNIQIIKSLHTSGISTDGDRKPTGK